MEAFDKSRGRGARLGSLSKFLACCLAMLATGCSAPEWISLCHADMTRLTVKVEAYVRVFDIHATVAFDPECPERQYPVTIGSSVRYRDAEFSEIRRAMSEDLAVRYRMEVRPYEDRGQIGLTILDMERIGHARVHPRGEEPPPPSAEDPNSSAE